MHALIPAAGTGSRAGEGAPKQYRLLAGKPLIEHTLAAFSQVARLASVLVVVAPDDTHLQEAPGRRIARRGGATRAASVANGLQVLLEAGAQEEDWVLVHDAARCLVTPELVHRLIGACVPDRVGGLLALPLGDTLKEEAQGRVATTVPRSGKWLAQTPQMFRLGVLRQALAHCGDRVTDEASAVEAFGLQPLLVPGSALNFKVTWPEDFLLAEAVLRSREQAP